MADKVDTSDIPQDVKDAIIREELERQAQAEPQQQLDPNTVECAMCGKPGFPPKGCQMCHGGAQLAPRQYTLSEVRSGRAPDDNRYGVKGETGPKIDTSLPGAGGQGGTIPK